MKSSLSGSSTCPVAHPLSRDELCAHTLPGHLVGAKRAVRPHWSHNGRAVVLLHLIFERPTQLHQQISIMKASPVYLMDQHMRKWARALTLGRACLRQLHLDPASVSLHTAAVHRLTGHVQLATTLLCDHCARDRPCRQGCAVQPCNVPVAWMAHAAALDRHMIHCGSIADLLALWVLNTLMQRLFAPACMNAVRWR